MLRYSKGFVGRFIARLLRLAVITTKFFGKRELSNLITMAGLELPLRNLAVFSKGRIDEAQVFAIVDMCNGHFFAGLHRYCKAKKLNKKRRKATKRISNLK